MFNIIEKRKILFLIPCVIILAGIISFIIFGGLNTDIDFTGGTAMEIELGQKYDEALIRKTIDAVDDVTVSSVQSSGAEGAIVKTTDIPHEKFVEVQDAIKAAFPSAEIKSVDNVNPPFITYPMIPIKIKTAEIAKYNFERCTILSILLLLCYLNAIEFKVFYF